MKYRWVAVTAAAAAALGACTYARPPDPYRPPAYYPDPRAAPGRLGLELYARDCAFCHGDDGRGTQRGPALRGGTNGPALTHFMLATGRMPIDSPDDPSRHRPSRYAPEEIDALTTYIARRFEQRGPDVPIVNLADANLSLGQQLYQDNCAACHAPSGIGGAMLATRRGTGPGGAGVHIPGFEDSTAIEIAEAIRTGPGTMPVFAEGALSGEEVDAIVRYVLYLKEPQDAGGAPIGRVGPVAEGAVGWLVGLGSLLLLIRWIGTRAGERG